MCLVAGVGAYCAFQDDSCLETGVRWDTSAELSRKCVTSLILNSQSDSTDRVANESKQLGQPCGPCQLGHYAMLGNKIECTGYLTEEVAQEKSPTRRGAPNEKTPCKDRCSVWDALDGSTSTAWFSPGSVLSPRPRFDWIADAPLCFTEITVTGNAKYQDENAGFQRMLVQVLDETGAMRVSQRMEYPEGKTPLTHDLGGVWGKTLRLELIQHQNDACGGFSELVVLAARKAEVK